MFNKKIYMARSALNGNMLITIMLFATCFLTEAYAPKLYLRARM